MHCAYLSKIRGCERTRKGLGWIFMSWSGFFSGC